MGIRVHLADPRDPEAIEALINERTRAVFLEAVANPAMVVPDFAAVSKICSRAGIPLVVDATVLTPYLFDARALGVAVTVYSGTKFLAGAATVMGGLIVDNGQWDWSRSTPPLLAETARQVGEKSYLWRLRRQGLFCAPSR